ncbi:DUF4242 domain-containing protein [Cesiribacter andamanensis]|uniref:DUF4242 domain-containing protein n=1 Tax=Cesiribacter andamanensis AMV16 TaxID=1279009 RepID=M7NK72_9BACT|nr:DUF4242 domain-containing protein [Cesiribacter andamanensis]EMR02175.1 hypothetical protein ADICEAN_02689 [Cesiribacter andamanensis AMV16]
MKKFIIERELPGAGKLTAEQLQGIAQTSCEVVNGLNKPYHWVESFVTDNKIYCVHIAEDAETILEHAKRGGFPATSIQEVKATIDPTTSTPA